MLASTLLLPPVQAEDLSHFNMTYAMVASLQARNTGLLVQCFYQLEDFSGLVKLTEVLTEGQPLLADIGAKLQSVGLCADAVTAFLKVCHA
jgi:WD repeat-containing protein 35